MGHAVQPATAGHHVHYKRRRPEETILYRLIQEHVETFFKRILRLLTHRGYLIEEERMTYLAETDSDLAMAPLHTAACTYRIAFGPRAGQKVLSLKTVPTQEPKVTAKRCVSEHGFSLHANLRCAANQRNQLEHLCRYITRLAIANERLERNSASDVVLQLKSPYRDGTTHIVMAPLDEIAGSDFEQPEVGPKGGGQDARSKSCNVWPLWSRVPDST